MVSRLVESHSTSSSTRQRRTQGSQLDAIPAMDGESAGGPTRHFFLHTLVKDSRQPTGHDTCDGCRLPLMVFLSTVRWSKRSALPSLVGAGVGSRGWRTSEHPGNPQALVEEAGVHLPEVLSWGAVKVVGKAEVLCLSVLSLSLCVCVRPSGPSSPTPYHAGTIIKALLTDGHRILELEETTRAIHYSPLPCSH